MPNKIMLDIETLGTKPGCIVRELGIVVFNETEILESYQYFFDIKTQEEKGLITEWDTAQWVLNGHLFETSGDLLNKLRTEYSGLDIYKDYNDGISRDILSKAWHQLYKLIDKDTEMWANGSTFDIPILEHFFKTFGLESPFKYYYNIRDLRTVMKFSDFDKKSIPDEPFPHLAVSDCFWQVKALQSIYKQFNIN